MASRTNQLPDLFNPRADECAGCHRAGGWLLALLGLRLRSDEQLVLDLQSGEADALTVLFERHGPLVFRIARRVLRNDADAEDATQQTFIDIFRAAPQFDPSKGNFKPWLLMFAYHRTFNLRRHLRTQPLEDLSSDIVLSQRGTTAEAGISIREALGLIRPRQRRVIELTYFEGLTAMEVSDLTGESVRVVRHNLYRGLEKLRLIFRTPSVAKSAAFKGVEGE
jgi:RNA polymerase sigma-70 factor (ECF subfamily)